MNTMEATNSIRPVDDRNLPRMTQKLGNTTFEVYVHFSETSKETLTDKVLRLIRNEINPNNLS